MAFVETQSSDQLTGDAAALASFLATGEIGPANQLSLRYDGKPADTLLYQAQRRGRAVGIISSGPVTSPGIAAFFAHQSDASVSATVANQLLDSTRIDLIFGGGLEIIETEKKVGHRDLLKEAEKLDYTLVFDRAGLQSFPAWNTRRILGLFASRDLPLAAAEDNGAGTVRLSDLVERAIETLAYNLLGYFLVVEHPLVAHAKTRRSWPFANSTSWTARSTPPAATPVKMRSFSCTAPTPSAASSSSTLPPPPKRPNPASHPSPGTTALAGPVPILPACGPDGLRHPLPVLAGPPPTARARMRSTAS
jgi:hypothetical protein